MAKRKPARLTDAEVVMEWLKGDWHGIVRLGPGGDVFGEYEAYIEGQSLDVSEEGPTPAAACRKALDAMKERGE